MPTDYEGYILSAEDLKLLQDVITRFKTRPSSGTGRPSTNEEDYFAPDFYVARSPGGGIPALTEEAGAGIVDTPGTASCNIYRLEDDSGVMKLQPMTGLAQTVYNLFKAVPANQWVQVQRDKFGAWWVAEASQILPSFGKNGPSTSVLASGASNLIVNPGGWTVGTAITGNLWVMPIDNNWSAPSSPGWNIGANNAFIWAFNPITGNYGILPVQSASQTLTGYVNTATQTFGGPKTFAAAVTMNTTLDVKGAVTVGLVATPAPLVVHGSGTFDASVEVGDWGVDTQSIYASGVIEAFQDVTAHRRLFAGGGTFQAGQFGTDSQITVYVGGPSGAWAGDPHQIRIYHQNNGHPTHNFEGWGWLSALPYRTVEIGYNAFTDHDHFAGSRVGSVWNSSPMKYPLDITDSVAAVWLSCGSVEWGTSGMTAPAYGPPNYPATQPIQPSLSGPGSPGIEFQVMVDPATNPTGLFNVVRGSLAMRYDGAFDFSTMHTAADPNTAGWVAAKGFWSNGKQGKSGSTAGGTFENGLFVGGGSPSPPSPPVGFGGSIP